MVDSVSAIFEFFFPLLFQQYQLFSLSGRAGEGWDRWREGGREEWVFLYRITFITLKPLLKWRSVIENFAITSPRQCSMTF